MRHTGRIEVGLEAEVDVLPFGKLEKLGAFPVGPFVGNVNGNAGSPKDLECFLPGLRPAENVVADVRRVDAPVGRRHFAQFDEFAQV